MCWGSTLAPYRGLYAITWGSQSSNLGGFWNLGIQERSASENMKLVEKWE